LLYRAFGLTISSDRLLPILPLLPNTVLADLSVFWLGQANKRLPEGSRKTRYIGPLGELTILEIANGAYVGLYYSDGIKFVIDRAGRKLWAAWPPTADFEEVVGYFLGPILGTLLRFRGINCLHASAIAYGETAVAFMGPTGVGKSTIATAFATLNFAVLTDDIAALVGKKDSFMVQPAYPLLRLLPTSVEVLFGSAKALPYPVPSWNKALLDLRSGGYRFQERALPLSAIYILNQERTRSTSSIENTYGQRGLMTLIANTYVRYALDKTMRAEDLLFFSQIMEAVPLRRVSFPADLAGISHLCEVILEDLAEICQ
jgi:hypothetical protein